ncbi:hypothetical protein [Microterricola viridarii]|uniref:Helix-turn-helix domain-containing protein n=1 Tax=Microterricola viridarii TaxID=412690 RepID=A0A1H1XVY3_9MICO|nr:hypothetical protein [Microterricola viridarii]SDT13285.1 hypothetical protein SAMN04489834_2901 [Microterricola viridarii]
MPFLADDTRAALARAQELDAATPTPASALDRLSAVRTLIAALEADAASLTAVREALASGADWGEIGAAARLSPAAAKARWQGDDAAIAERQQASRKRSARPSAKPTDLPGLSVAEAADKLGVTAQAIYLRVTRGQLEAQTIELPDGRKYKRVFLPEG